jgi:Di-haem oxidoreductase, putative peroxidase
MTRRIRPTRRGHGAHAMTGLALVWLALLLNQTSEAQQGAPPPRQLGREVAVPQHLRDDEEFRMTLPDLIAHGKLLFAANWTNQDGAGRPLSKGTGKQLADQTQPLTGSRGFNRVSGPDANSCAGCHNSPYGIAGGAGDIVTNVFVLAQRFDFVSFDQREDLPTKGTVDEENQDVSLSTVGNSRATTHMFGAGYLEMLARQMTAELQAIRNSVRLGESKALNAKGISFGRIARSADGLWDTSHVEGLPWPSLVSHGSNDPPSLVIRPWHQAGNVVSLREFTNTAFNQHHGIQTTERFGIDTDPDGDGIVNEMTRADVTAVTLYQAVLQVPGRVIPNDPVIEEAVRVGERTFSAIGCATCHIPSLALDKDGWMFSEPNPYNPPGNLRRGEAETIRFDLNDPRLPMPRLAINRRGVVDVPAYTDFKLHDITNSDDEREPLDMNRATWSPTFKAGNRKFLTKRLWGVASAPNHFHHGLLTTMREAVLEHSGEAIASRRAFQALPEAGQDALIEFLKTLQVLPPGTKDLIVDDQFHSRRWPVDLQLPTGVQP